MIMMKRILSLALALALGTTLLSGCSKGDGSEEQQHQRLFRRHLRPL